MNAANNRGGLLEPPARALVWATKRLVRFRLLLSGVGLVLTFLAGGGYLLLGTLQINPLESRYRVRVELAQSGGLLPDQDVTLRGVRVGRVQSVDVTGDKVLVVAEIDQRTKIPATGGVRVAALSAAGEQFLDFLPSTDSGRYLSDGELITAERTSTPTTMAEVLGDLNGTLAQIDPAELQAIMGELGVSADGPNKLAAILDGGMFMISTLDSVLPQTVSLLHNSKTVLTTLGEAGTVLGSTGHNLSETMSGVAAMTGGFGTLVDNTPGLLTTADQIIANNSQTMVQLLGNLATVSQMSYLHIPALQEFFFPQQRTGSTLDAVSTAIRDGGVWALASPYPRYACDYNVPRRPGTIPDFPEPYLHARCPNPDPSVLVRGAANAPRPPGDNTATTPPGVDPLATADPTPAGPFTIPTPYGGANAPLPIPTK
ncbi:MlaD family protein [Nocardia sp. NBC_00565]|uniref:MlaD family protein n=1 Tax=Nocardia sp. NBC_00565 TaxID=2975993 RepID=UPI002E81C7AE|nr:MlaD family protein [Nocardia sp. NBC_00565]WUC05851.1 MlaD family protein [Nocardia sp. NBC_00565]